MLASLSVVTMIAMQGSTRPPAKDQTVDDSLRFTLVAPDTVRSGAPIRFTLHLTNVTDRPVEAHFLGRKIAFDIVVARQDGAVVWRRLAGAVVPGILQVKVLDPHESLQLSDTWTQRGDDAKPVAPGSYTAWGVLPSDEREPRRTPTVTLRIVP